MARSGERARNLKKLVSRVADVSDKVTLSRPTWDGLVAVGIAQEVIRIYRMLGGMHEQPRVAPGPWDLQIGEVAIELDEENHFNRYRALTLDSSLYRRLEHLDAATYRAWCASREAACLTYGKYWSTPVRARVRSARASRQPQWPRSATLEAARFLRSHQGSQSNHRASEGHEGLDLRGRVVPRKHPDDGRAASQR
jgi:hypothetical protein